ncbi:MAG: Crp/Fnr family transcriptional regulator [Vicinamibacterales bacterium]
MATRDEAAELTRRLAALPLFRGVPPDGLRRIQGLARPHKVRARQCFFNEGDAAKTFFVLTSGRVKLTQVTPEGHQVVLRIIGEGEAFGGAGAFGDLTYPVSAEAVEPARALAWTSTAMRQLMETEPRLALNAVQFVAGRLHDLQRRYRQLMTERVERRVARALLRLAHQAGRSVEAGVQIAFPVSRQDVAEMTGTTLYTVSRLLSAWEARGIVLSGRQRITLTQPLALISLAEDLLEP